MNGKNKVLIGCLALLLVMSIGYALFSDTITINGIATAKGNFQLTTTCDMVVDDEFLGGGKSESGSVTDAKITCEGNVVNASATLGYPGSAKWFRVMVKNTGTIPAKMKRVLELSRPTQVSTYENPGPALTYNCSGSGDDNKVCASLFSDYNVGDDYSTSQIGVTYEPPGNYASEFEAVLDPGETAYYYIEMVWGSSSTTPGEPLTATMNAQIDWEQVTVE